MLRFSAHLGYLFTELPLRGRFAAARAAGFDAVEHPDPYEVPADELRRILAGEGLAFVQFAAPPGDRARGEKGIAPLPGREAEFRAAVATGLEYAVRVGAPFLQIQSGVIPPGADEADLFETYVANLRLAGRDAAARGIDLLIEPIGPATLPGYFMSRSDLALRALAAIDCANVRLLFDVFHSANAGVPPAPFIAEHAAKIGHLHMADLPGRHEPGSGTIDFAEVFAVVEASGFGGVIGCEYKPAGTTLAGLGWFAPYQASTVS
jgi:hydroxypyruvate isomerase